MLTALGIDPLFHAALVAGLAVGTVCSLLSVIVVLKRMAFVGEGVSHAGYGGVGVAIFLGLGGWSQDALVLGFCVGVAVLIGLLSRRRHVEPDSAIGILLVASMALGVLMGDLRRNLQDQDWYVRWVPAGPPPNVEALLFGSLMTVTWPVAWVALAIAAGVLLTCLAFSKEILFFTFDEPVSRVFGVRTGLIHYLLLVLLAAAIVVSVRLAGFILVGALLVIPGATAVLLSRRLGLVLLWAWLIGMAGTLGGLILSIRVGNLSTGPCIVGVLCAIFAAVFAARSLGRGRAAGEPTA